MKLPDIRLFPDRILRQACKKVVKFDQKLLDLVERLCRVMEKQPSGIGIAAPQIGINEQVAVVDVSARVAGSKRLVLINPEIVGHGSPQIQKEGCMSIPEYTAFVNRYEEIRCRYQDVSGIWKSVKSHGIEARCIQHEVDHLNGKLFIDRVACLKTDMFARASKSRRSKRK